MYKKFSFDDNRNNLDEKCNFGVKNLENKKRKKILGVYSALSVILLSIITFSIFYFFGDSFKNITFAYDDNNDNNISDTMLSTPVYDYENEEMRGVWIASVANINFPSETELSEKELKKEIDDIVKNVAEAGLNTIFFQVRPCSDALYASEIFPYSKYVSGKQGIAPDNNFDCLAYMLEKAKERNIDVHAWVNPYRITMNEKEEKDIARNSPAFLHPEYTVKYADGKTYYNPGIPEVRDIVISGVVELAEKYPSLSGIHFDDYFYPYPSNNADFNDQEQYEKYGSGLSKQDWRRSNVNNLIRDTYKAIKEVNPDIKFGVSPFGIWANSGSNTPVEGSISSGLEAYSSLYCDALEWIKGGYVDYLIPQIYWSFETSSAPFDNIARWWNANLDSTGVDLFIGHAAYKAAEFDENEIGIQVEFARNLMSYKGSVFYGYEDIKNNTKGLKDKLKSLNTVPIKYDDKGKDISARVNNPANNYQSTAPTVTLVGQSDKNYPLEINGNKVSRTKDGYFSYFTDISFGINVFTLNQNGRTTSHNINYKNQRTSSASQTYLSDMEILDIIPKSQTWLSVSDTLTVSCVAPAGCVVTAKIGGMSFELKPTINRFSTGKYVKEIYMGSIKPSTFVSEDEIATLGTLTITATGFGKTVTEKGGVIKQIGEKALVFAEVLNDYSYLKISPTSSFYDDYTPASKGMRDYVRGLSGSYYKLKFGGYIEAENVKIVEGIELNENVIFSVKAFVNGTDTSNNKNNFTDVVFECLENAPVNAVAFTGKIDVTFYNTASMLMPKPEIQSNPLISDITASTDDYGNIVYSIHFKDEYNVYGYNVLYENGNIIIRLNNPQTLWTDAQKPLLHKTIVIDPGHGGTDKGAPGCGDIGESLINLEISLNLKNELENLGATVIMTRSDDNTTVSLEERIEIINNITPDLAVSVHQNSIASSSNTQKIRGYLGLYSTEAGKLLAKTVSKRVSSDLNRYERPVAYQKLAVARNHRYPSTLCEMCFISNVEEYQWSVTPGNALRSAKAIANGILDYYKCQEGYLAY